MTNEFACSDIFSTPNINFTNFFQHFFSIKTIFNVYEHFFGRSLFLGWFPSCNSSRQLKLGSNVIRKKRNLGPLWKLTYILISRNVWCCHIVQQWFTLWIVTKPVAERTVKLVAEPSHRSVCDKPYSTSLQFYFSKKETHLMLNRPLVKMNYELLMFNVSPLKKKDPV